MCNVADRRDIQYLESRIAKCFAKNQAGVITNGVSECVGVSWVDERRIDPKPWQSVLK